MRRATFRRRRRPRRRRRRRRRPSRRRGDRGRRRTGPRPPPPAAARPSQPARSCPTRIWRRSPRAAPPPSWGAPASGTAAAAAAAAAARAQRRRLWLTRRMASFPRSAPSPAAGGCWARTTRRPRRATTRCSPNTTVRAFWSGFLAGKSAGLTRRRRLSSPLPASVTIVFADIVGFTALSEHTTPEATSACGRCLLTFDLPRTRFLWISFCPACSAVAPRAVFAHGHGGHRARVLEGRNECASSKPFATRVSQLSAEACSLPVGDCFMAACGLFPPHLEPSSAAAAATLFCLRAHAAASELGLRLRAGVHTGPVTAGLSAFWGAHQTMCNV